MKLSELDKKILFELDKDGRAGYSEIGRAIGTTAQVVKYHVESLVFGGAIKNFWAFADYEKAGYPFFWAYWLKFSGLTKEDEEFIFSYFQQNQNMPIVLRCRGYADAMICITTKDVFEHNAVLKKFLSKFGKKIAMMEMAVGMGFESFPRTYLIGKENEYGVANFSGSVHGLAKLSENERKMLSILQVDGRMEWIRVAEILDLSVSSVHAMFERLNKKQVITKTAMTLNHAEIGIRAYRVLFKLLQYDEEKLKVLYDFCVKHSNIRNYIPVMGNWQLMLDIETENDEQIHDILREMRYQFKEVIAEVEIAEVQKIEKFSQMVIEYPELLEGKKAEEKIELKKEKEAEAEKYW
ncbi:MAG: winged helix-turn-helix transcriptional regulator [Parcubacteria group bacterium]